MSNEEPSLLDPEDKRATFHNKRRTLIKETLDSFNTELNNLMAFTNDKNEQKIAFSDTIRKLVQETINYYLYVLQPTSPTAEEQKERWKNIEQILEKLKP
jgi:hypothetical protein